ncbi:MAG: hypothetical protein AAF388_00025 [Bacteroidota bacterium]
MQEPTLNAEDLLLGSEAQYDISIPKEILFPGGEEEETPADPSVVRLKPLTIGVFQLIMKASRNDPGLIPLLMVKEALISPNVSLDQLRKMHVGLIEFLVDEVRNISGLTKKKRISH